VASFAGAQEDGDVVASWHQEVSVLCCPCPKRSYSSPCASPSGSVTLASSDRSISAPSPTATTRADHHAGLCERTTLSNALQGELGGRF
jgi:hypothetical protein